MDNIEFIPVKPEAGDYEKYRLSPAELTEMRNQLEGFLVSQGYELLQSSDELNIADIKFKKSEREYYVCFMPKASAD